MHCTMEKLNKVKTTLSSSPRLWPRNSVPLTQTWFTNSSEGMQLLFSFLHSKNNPNVLPINMRRTFYKGALLKMF